MRINIRMFFIGSICIALQISTVIENYLKVAEGTKLKNSRFINKSTACQGFRNSCFCQQGIQCLMLYQGIPYLLTSAEC